jgi:N-dimethylarginine dimethylaminohydrolase
MTTRFGGQNVVDPIRRVLVKRPDDAFAVQDPKRWHYTSRPDLAAAQEEHDALVEILRQAGAEILYHDEAQPDRADSIYVFDPVLITNQGAIVLRMGKPLRRGEEQAIATELQEIGVPIRLTLGGEALAEGGDLLWLDEKTLFAGIGFRTNQEGVRQLREELSPSGVRVVEVDLPFFTGPEACLHLLSMISLVDHDMAVVYPPLLPVALWQELDERRFHIIEVPDQEFLTMGTNILALAPRECLMIAGNPITRGRLEKAGCRVHTYRGHEISLKAEGGPTCLTRPILRAV